MRISILRDDFSATPTHWQATPNPYGIVYNNVGVAKNITLLLIMGIIIIFVDNKSKSKFKNLTLV